MYKMNMKDSLRQVSYHFNFRFTSHGKVYIKHPIFSSLHVKWMATRPKICHLHPLKQSDAKNASYLKSCHSTWAVFPLRKISHLPIRDTNGRVFIFYCGRSASTETTPIIAVSIVWFRGFSKTFERLVIGYQIHNFLRD